MDKEKLKQKLEIKLKREPFPQELINAEKDVNLINELIQDEIEDIKKRLTVLEKS